MSLPYLHCFHVNALNVCRIPSILSKTLKENPILGWRPLFQDTASFSAEAKAVAKKSSPTSLANQTTHANPTRSEPLTETIASSIQKDAEQTELSSNALITLKPAKEELVATYPVVQHVKNWVTESVSSLRSFLSERLSFGFWKQEPKTNVNASAMLPETLEKPISPAFQEAHTVSKPMELQPQTGDIPAALRIEKKPANATSPSEALPVSPTPLSQKELEQQAFWRSMFSTEELKSGGAYHDRLMEELNEQIDDVLQGRENLIADCLFEHQNAAPRAKGFN